MTSDATSKQTTTPPAKARGPEPGSASWLHGVSVLSPWGWIAFGCLAIVVGIVVMAVGAAQAVSDIEIATGTEAKQTVGPLVAQIAGGAVAALGAVFAMLGVIAEGVRIGTLYARHQ